MKYEGIFNEYKKDFKTEWLLEEFAQRKEIIFVGDLFTKKEIAEKSGFVGKELEAFMQKYRDNQLGADSAREDLDWAIEDFSCDKK